jgi:hypothetical protein
VSFLREFRLKVGLYFLRKHADKVRRGKGIISFSKLKSVVLLFETDMPTMPPAIETLTHTLNKENKKVYQVIYYTGEIEKLEYGPHEKRLIFTGKDLNIFYKPSKRTIEGFAAITADYIIDLNLIDCFPLIYLAGISEAHMRIGRQSEMRLPHYDLLINSHTEDQQEFFQHLLHYIKILIPQFHEQLF